MAADSPPVAARKVALRTDPSPASAVATPIRNAAAIINVATRTAGP
jgi:hypothetical protein